MIDVQGEDITLPGELVHDEVELRPNSERLNKLTHLYAAKRRSTGEALAPLKIPTEEKDNTTNVKKTMSVEKIMGMKGNYKEETKSKSLPRRLNFEEMKALQEELNDPSLEIAEVHEIPPPLPPLPNEDFSSPVTMRQRSETIGEIPNHENGKKPQRIGAHLSSKRPSLPAINITRIQQEGEGTEEVKTMDFASALTNGTYKKLPTVNKDQADVPPTQSKGKRHSDRGQGTFPVIFRDFSLAAVGSKSNNNGTQKDQQTNNNGHNNNNNGNNAHNTIGNNNHRPPLQYQRSKSNHHTMMTARPNLQSKSPSTPRTPKEYRRKDQSNPSNGTPINKASSSRPSGTPREKATTPRKQPPAASPTVLKNKNLTPYEQKEIVEYSEVFYTGENCTTKIINASKTAANKGYDDEKGDYKITLRDHIAYRYEVMSLLGQGAFGQVAKVMDHKNNKLVALKVIRNRKRYHDQALIEHKILAYVKQKDPQGQSNIVNMIDFFYFRNHICFTFDLLSINLYDFIKANHFRGHGEKLVRKFAVRLLQSMKFLAKHHIIHCDLKPENILLNAPDKSTITLIDFGSSCFDHEKIFTYIQSRFYRAPEIILGLPYSISIDMWSYACILAELLTGYPLFPGENELDQLACIMEVLNCPPEDLLLQASRRKYFFASNGKPRIIENSQGIKRFPGTRKLEELVPNGDPLFINFLIQCLQWHPKDRLTPSTAMQHPWILQVGAVENLDDSLED